MVEDDAALWVDTHGQIIGNEAQDALAQRANSVAVSDDLIIGHQNPRFNAAVLQFHAVLQRAEIVPQVQLSGRPVAGEDAESRRILINGFLKFNGSGLCPFQRSVVGGIFKLVFTTSHARSLPNDEGCVLTT